MARLTHELCHSQIENIITIYLYFLKGGWLNGNTALAFQMEPLYQINTVTQFCVYSKCALYPFMASYTNPVKQLNKRRCVYGGNIFL